MHSAACVLVDIVCAHTRLVLAGDDMVGPSSGTRMN